METYFRLYGLNGCGHCVKAVAFLTDAKIPTHVVEVTGDPVIDAGVKAVLGKETAEYPVLISFVTKQVISGFKLEDYTHVAEVYNTSFRPVSPDAFTVKSNDSPAPETVVAESAPSTQGVV